MDEKPSHDRYPSITFGDLRRIMRRRRGTIFLWMVIFGALTFIAASLRPVRYEAQASFLDRGAQAGNLQGTQSILGALAGLTTENGNQVTVEILKSNRLLQTLAQKHSLQASLMEVGHKPTLLDRFIDNLRIEKAYWTKQIPELNSLTNTPLQCTVAAYTQELPSEYTVRFSSNDQFQIVDASGNSVEGQLGLPIVTSTYAITLQCPGNTELSGRNFILSLMPLPEVAEELAKRLDVVPHRECSDLILLTFQYPDRELVGILLNGLMEGYRDYLREQNKELADGQLAYLAERKRSATEDLHKMLSEHAVALADEVSQTGILSAKAEINHLGIARAKAKQDLLEIDSELRLLEKINPDDPHYIKILGTATNLPTPIANGIKQIQNLHLRRDCLRLALEQTTHSLEPIPSDLEGIDLEMANRLYLTHAEKLNTLEINQRQNNFILQQLQDPAFEVSSISGAVQDSVSADIIKRSAQATLELKETDYRSQREQERTRKELAQEREFLIAHLTQTNHLQELQKDFLREKIRHTQEIMLRLIEQELEAANKQLADFVAGRAVQLRQERAAGLDTVTDIRQQMMQIPKVWASEVLLEQISTTNSKLAEEVSKLVESKNIAHNLEVIQSGPLDRAATPIVPRPSYLVLFVVIGFTIGGLFSTLIVLFNELSSGIPAARTNLPNTLALTLVEVPRRTSKRTWQDLFLRLQYTLCKKTPSIILTLIGDGPDYTSKWVDSLIAQGKRVQRLNADGINQVEMKDWLKNQTNQCEFIIVVSNSRADSIAGRMLLDQFDFAAVSITDERLQQLEYLSQIHTQVAIIVFS